MPSTNELLSQWGREGGSCHYLHFKERDIEKQRGQISAPRSHRWEMAEPGSKEREAWHQAICLPEIVGSGLLAKKSSAQPLPTLGRLAPHTASPNPLLLAQGISASGLPAVLRLAENRVLCRILCRLEMLSLVALLGSQGLS